MRAEPLLVLAVALGAAAPARASEPVEEAAVDPIERVARREVLLTERASEAALRARLSALTAYRLARRTSVRFLVAPETRGKDARARAAALLVLRRHVQEASALERERAQASTERAALEKVSGQLSVEPDPEEESPLASGDEEDGPGLPAGRGLLVRPARAPVIGRPGLRTDPATNAIHRLIGLEYLHRLNQPVRATATGVVRRVEALPQGGFAVVLEHAADPGMVSVVTGLRRVDVQPGQAVKPRETLGICGRNLDGAPMVGFELWRAGVPVDPGPLLEDRRDRRDRRRRATQRPHNPRRNPL
jgi:murein DD-endopeptidase MepM/ murein hydrolase activator NlpD